MELVVAYLTRCCFYANICNATQALLFPNRSNRAMQRLTTAATASFMGAFGIVLTLSFVLLAVAFRSLVVPLKAIVLNLAQFLR